MPYCDHVEDAYSTTIDDTIDRSTNKKTTVVDEELWIYIVYKYIITVNIRKYNIFNLPS